MVHRLAALAGCLICLNVANTRGNTGMALVLLPELLIDPVSLKRPYSAPRPAPMAQPAKGMRNSVPKRRPQNPPHIAPPAVEIPSWDV